MVAPIPDGPRRTRVVAQALLVTFLWSTSWVLIKVGLRDLELEPLGFAGVRYALAAVVLLPLAAARWRDPERPPAGRRHLGGAVILGVLLYGLTQGAQFAALDLLPAATVGLFLSATPALVAIAAVALRQERASRGQVLGIAIFVAGAALYFGGPDATSAPAIGIAIAAVCVLANAASAVLGRVVARDAIRQLGGAVVMTTLGMAVGGSLLVAVGIALEGPPRIGPAAWLILAWLVVVNTAFAFVLWNDSLRVLTAVESSVLNNLMLVQIAALAWIFLGETLDARELVGIALALAGIVVVQLVAVRRSSARRA
jgi:drug/metabolite transporter (DMT)-like permease